MHADTLCNVARLGNGLDQASSGRPEPKRQLETTAACRSVPSILPPWNTCCSARYPGMVLMGLNGSPAKLEVKGLSTSSVCRQRGGENQPTYLTFHLPAYLKNLSIFGLNGFKKVPKAVKTSYKSFLNGTH